MKEKRVPVERYSRIVGYYRPVNQWNKGKKEEFKERKVFKTKEEKHDVSRQINKLIYR